MKKLAFLGCAGALSVAAVFHAPLVQAADHLDAPGVTSSPMADINDVYVWMTSDALKVNLALTVSPDDDGTRAFGPSIQYVFHVTEHPGFLMPGTESKVICTFASNTSGQCWLVDPDGDVQDYVTGDLSGATGRASASGKFRVFAGRRSDPFFFNLQGFRNAATTVKNAAGALSPDAAGCPQAVDGTLGGTLRTQLQAQDATADAPCPNNQRDCFLDFNVMAIVVQIDKDMLLSDPNKLLSVWASTHMTP